MTSPLLPPRSRKRLDESIPPIIRPLIRAYVLGYASTVTPRLLTLILKHVTRSRRDKGAVIVTQPHDSFISSLQRIVRGGLELQRFPTFCAALVGGTTLLEARSPMITLYMLDARFETYSRCYPESVKLTYLSIEGFAELASWLSTFIAAWLSLRLLQSKKSDGFSKTVTVDSDDPQCAKQETVHYAGRTLDLTLFAVTRALDVIVSEVWTRRGQRRVTTGKWTWAESLVSKLADPTIFATSSALIMWAWFYYPSQLPKAYTKWISSAAAIDLRLIEALKRCRNGELRYGEETGQAPLLQSMCEDYRWPLAWGDPVQSIPFPCHLVHMRYGVSCEYNALSRFFRSFKWAMTTYLPLNLLARKKNLKGVKMAFLSAARSSSFLATFIALFYYGVCLARTRLGPHVVGKDTRSRQTIDQGLCIGVGCFLCGWSVLVEKAARRKELALFVAPRAMATLLPRRYSLDKQWRETFVFAFSTAVVFTCVKENRGRVRGMFGRLLGAVLEP
ncbi:uncharacterized protein F4812DRAFT_467804 [Daldinia caldariorum]|uniref:uncharacterized protein n=1 Tax=Daldinia caldariorum TaxID=326644 RepID=UPI0020078D9A|nr:uncharacterized protein F4812DRAFT_467804 [Daldinia caldariorum]KAI1471917.1 hypothetical protein F4812DRAFT_467804 [Daldinia caldariorum]